MFSSSPTTGLYANRLRPFFASPPRASPSRAGAASRRHGAPSTNQWQSPVWSRPRRACLRGCGPSPLSQIRRPGCSALFPRVHLRGRAPMFLSLASNSLLVPSTEMQNPGCGMDYTNPARSRADMPAAVAQSVLATPAMRSHKYRPALLAAALLLAATAIVYSVAWMYYVRGEPTVEIGIDTNYLDQAIEVTNVYHDSPAEKAGLKPHDRITAINGVPIPPRKTRFDVLQSIWVKSGPGDKVILRIERPREANPLTLTATFRAIKGQGDTKTLGRTVAEQILDSYPVLFLIVGLTVLFLRVDNRDAWLLAMVFASFITAPGLPRSFGVAPDGLRHFLLAFNTIVGGLLPAYPWDRERCWMDPPAGDIGIRSQYLSSDGAAKHSLLGRHFKSAQTETHFWESALDRNALSYLDDHRVEGLAILPAALYLEMALAAAAEAFPSQSFVLKDVEFRKALFIPDGATRTLQVILSPGADAAASVHIYSCPREAEQANRSWTLHATAKICLELDPVISPVIEPVVEREAPAQLQARCSEQISGQDYYLRLRESGVDYGPSFQSIAQLWRCNREMLGEVKIPDESHREFDACQFHPALLDACFQTLGAGVAAQATGNDEQRPSMPTHIDELRVHGAPGLHLWSHAHLQEPGADSVKGDVRLLDETGHAAVEIIGLRFDSIGPDTKRAADENIDDWLYEFQWQPRERSNDQPAPQPSAPASPGNWLIFADSSGVGEKLGALIKAQGDGSVLVTRGESYERTDGGHFRINAERPEDMRQLLETVLADDQPICRAVVHLWSLDASLPDETTVTSLKTAQTLGCNSVLQLVQELARVERNHLPRLWLIPRGAQPAGGGDR